MGRRKQLQGLANDFCHSFISRNNDICGYWGIGVLYRYANLCESLEMTLSLTKRSIDPVGALLHTIIHQYQEQFYEMLERQGLQRDWVKQCIVRLEFDTSTPPTTRFGEDLGDPFLCEVVTVDDSGKKRSAARMQYCRPHDPRREQRSTRAKTAEPLF